MAEICVDDTDACCLVPLFEDYGLFFTQRHTFFLKQQSVVMVISQMMV